MNLHKQCLPSCLILSNSAPNKSSSSVTSWLKLGSSKGFHCEIASAVSFLKLVDIKSPLDKECPDAS